MENNITPVEKVHIKDDEIDLYEILEIILRRKLLIIATIIVGTFLSFGAALYYSRNMNTETYAQDFNINYSIFYGEYLQRTANFRIVEILALLNNDDVIEEFFVLKELEDEYKKNSNDILSEREIIKKRAFLKKILNISLRSENADERGFSNKEYTITIKLQKGSNFHHLLIEKAIEIFKRELNEEITDKLTEVILFSENNMEIYRHALEEISGKSGVLNDLKEMKIDNLESLLRYIDPLSVAIISENIKGYEINVDLKNDIEIVREKMRHNDIFEKRSSIYFVEERGYAKILLLIGFIFSGFLGIVLAFVKEFWANFRKIVLFR